MSGKSTKSSGIETCVLLILTLIVGTARIVSISSEGKDFILKSFPSWFKEEVLVKIGNAYINNTKEQ